MSFTHLDDDNRPQMVDIGHKKVTRRSATAQAIVVLSEAALAAIETDGELHTKKGPVFQTAILAGIMAVKRTSELIPLCHPLPLEKINVDIRFNEAREVVVDCTVCLSGKTGVEMEALTGASIAALTVYDMCKAFGQDMHIRDTRLVEKAGGKSDYKLT